MSLEEIKARCEAATPGPWKWEGQDGVDLSLVAGERNSHVMHARWTSTGFVGIDSWCEVIEEADAEFIAHARQDIEVLLKRLALAEAACESASKLIESGNRGNPWDDLFEDCEDAVHLKLAVSKWENFLWVNEEEKEPS